MGERNADDVDEDTIVVDSTAGTVGFSRSGSEPPTPERVADEVQTEADRRFDLESLTPGTVLGVVHYDTETAEIASIRWEDDPA